MFPKLQKQVCFLEALVWQKIIVCTFAQQFFLSLCIGGTFWRGKKVEGTPHLLISLPYLSLYIIKANFNYL